MDTTDQPPAWDDGWARAWATTQVASGLVPARVVRIDKGGIRVARRADEATHVVAAKAVRRVVVGDVVGVDPTADRIEAILPRRTVFERRSPGVQRDEMRLGTRALAANMDHVLVLQPLDGGVNPPRLCRELVLAWQSGATPVVVLTKADLCGPHDARGQELNGLVGPEVPVLAIDARSPDAAQVLAPWLHEGRTLVLVGSSGAGKSTLVDVILGLLPPSTGRMTVDGVDVKDNIRGWQRLVGYVPQSIYLSDDTIRHNVAFGLPDDLIDEAAVRRAVHAARLDDFIGELADGIDTFVGERGVRLSGGQRQRIGIARALYHDPQILVLDEATSSLDDPTEREVMAAVNSLHGTKTLIIVAHRLSTVAECDILCRIDRGRIVQSGTYAEVVSS